MKAYASIYYTEQFEAPLHVHPHYWIASPDIHPNGKIN
jgi:hypothetical protein